MPQLFGFFSPGPTELIVIAVIVLLLFGNRLPSVMHSLGRGIVEFKKGVKGVEDEVDQKKKIDDRGDIDGKVNKEPFKE